MNLKQERKREKQKLEKVLQGNSKDVEVDERENKKTGRKQELTK